MGESLFNLPIHWMALLIFSAVYLLAAAIYFTVIGLAVDDRARAFKALSPGMLPPLGIIFGLLVGFVAVQVWSQFDRAETAVTNEASALRAIVLLAQHFPDEQRSHLRALVNSHIEEAVQQEWPAMAEQQATLGMLPQRLVQCLDVSLNVKPADESQATVQREIVDFVGKAAEARRQRIVISQSSVSPVKWAAIVLIALITLIAIAMVHSDNRLTCGIALALFATGIAASVLLIAAYTRPFTGDISVKPDLLQQVITSESAIGASAR
jgi:positive regulator of sigma E activity